MGKTFEGVAKYITLAQAIEEYNAHGLAKTVNDGKDVTIELEKPLASKHKGQK